MLNVITNTSFEQVNQDNHLRKLRSKSKNVGKYLLLNTIGQGKFKVKKALDVTVNGSKHVALKFFTKSGNEYKHNYEQEKVAYSRFHHKNVLKMIEHFEDFYYMNQQGSLKAYNVLALEYAAKGDLFSFIEKTKFFDEKISRQLFSQMIEGIQHIHNNGYAHLDLKLENIYFDENYELKIADFDLARQMTQHDFNPRRIGSMNYMAPEILEDKSFNGIKVDIFALGVLLFVINSGKLPFVTAASTDTWYRHIKARNYDLFWDLHARRGIHFPPGLRVLITSMLSYNPHHRPSINEIIGSFWMNQEQCTFEEYYQDMDNKYSRMTSQ